MDILSIVLLFTPFFVLGWIIILWIRRILRSKNFQQLRFPAFLTSTFLFLKHPPAGSDPTIMANPGEEMESEDEKTTGTSSPQAASQPRPETSLQNKYFFALALLVASLACIGQIFLTLADGENHIEDAVLFLAASIAIFLAIVWYEEKPSGWQSLFLAIRNTIQRGVDIVRANPLRAVLVAVAFELSYLVIRSLWTKTDPSPYWDVLGLWIASCAAYVAAFWRTPDAAWKQKLHAHRWDLLAMAFFTVIAAAIRFWNLGAVPDIISGDEGIIGNWSAEIARGEYFNIFSTINGQSMLYQYFIAGTIKLFGNTPLGLRLIAAIGGTISIPLMYLLGYHMFSRRVAILAAGLLTVSHIHLHYSRVIVATSIQDALMAMVVFCFLYLGLKNRSVVYLMLSGMALGFHFHIYMGAKLLILLVPVVLLAVWITDRKMLRENAGGLLAGLGGLAVTFAPFSVWVIIHPDEFFSRVNQMGILQTGWVDSMTAATGLSAWQIILEQIWKAFLSIIFYPAQMHYGSMYPMTDVITGAFLMIGLAYAVAHLTDLKYLILLGWFWSCVLTAAFVVDPETSVYRILMILPAVILIAVKGFDQIVHWMAKGRNGLHPAYAMSIFLISVSFINIKAYFPDFIDACRWCDWSTRASSLMGQDLVEAGPTYKAFLFGNNDWHYGIHPSVNFLTGGMAVINVDVMDLHDDLPQWVDREQQTISMPEHGPAIFFFHPDRKPEMGLVKRLLPGGVVEIQYDCGEIRYYIYRID